MKMKLEWIQIRNFKGITSFDQKFDGKNATITASNRKGKTTVLNAVLWLFHGKDSKGRTDFEIAPLHKKTGHRIQGLATIIEAGYLIDGISHVFKKERVENLTKHEKVVGYACHYWIDEISMLLNKYNAYIDDIITQKRFRLLTDINYFCQSEKKGGIKPTERRKILMEFAGEDVTIPEGFDELITAADGKSLDDFKKVLKARISNPNKSGYKDQLEKTKTQIEENLRNMVHPDFDVKEQEQQRLNIEGDIQIKKNQRKWLRTQETERQTNLDKVNELKTKKVERETELACDTSAIQDLIDKKAMALEELNMLFDVTNTSISALKILQNGIEEAERNQSIALAKINLIRDGIKGYENADVKTICSECNQKYPDGMLDECKQRRQDKVDALQKESDAEMYKVETSELVISDLNAKLEIAKELAEEHRQDHADFEAMTKKGNEEIDEKIKSRPTPPPDKDARWIEICTEIAKAEDEVGEPVTEQLNKLDTEQEAKQTELDKINEGLNQADRIEKDKLRIQELKEKEVRDGQGWADSEKLLKDIELYKQAESAMITKSVNKKFDHVTFKMFRTFLGSDDIEECCEVLLDGVPYVEMSDGELIYVGADCINTFSKYYDCDVPLFIDRAESLSLPIAKKSQIIKLFMKGGVKELQVTLN